MLFNPMKRALRNSALLSLAVGLVMLWQDNGLMESGLTALFTFMIITPAFWFSYQLANKLAKKMANNHTNPPENKD